MHIGYTPEQDALRKELRAYFQALMAPELQAELQVGEGGNGPLAKAAVRQMGADGWLGIGWPVEYGGQGRSSVEQFIFFDESQRARAPVPFLSINTIGPTIMRFGSEEQKQQLLPAILRGELHFSIGYSEPNAGTDLASLQTRAVRDGEEWVINGQKVFTSLAQGADYIWLATRTDPDAPKHKGISIFLVPTSAEGFSYTPIHTIGGGFTTATYYEDVRVPDSAMVGGVNNGWRLITNQLNHERVGLAAPGFVESLLDEVTAWATETRLADGRRVIDQEWVQTGLARVEAKVEFLRLCNWNVAWSITRNVLQPADASSTKVFGTEFFIEAYRILMEILGQPSYLEAGTTGALLAGRLERAFRATVILTFGGGVNEIQRDIIAMVGLGMPRADR